jgi:ERF superfamily
MSEGKQIYPAIASIMSETAPIAKSNKNSHQGYMFRSIDQFYSTLQSVMAKWGVFTVPEVLDDKTEERVNKNGTAMIYRILKVKYRFYAGDGSFIEATVMGEGVDNSDKASNKALAAAHKYALMQVFCIPTEEAKDSENDSHELAPKTRQPQAAQRQEPVSEKKVQSSQDVVPVILKAFAGFDVTRVMLEEFLQNTRLESMTKDQTQMLRDVLHGFKTKELAVEQVFGKSKRTTDQLNEAFSS